MLYTVHNSLASRDKGSGFLIIEADCEVNFLTQTDYSSIEWLGGGGREGRRERGGEEGERGGGGGREGGRRRERGGEERENEQCTSKRIREIHVHVCT